MIYNFLMRPPSGTAHGLRAVVLSLALIAASLVAGCGESLDVANELLVTDVATGWFDNGILPDGRNKLVPQVSFKLKNSAQNRISVVTVMGVFRVLEDVEELGSSTVKAISIEGLPVGDSTQPIVMRAGLGYAGMEPRLDMLENRAFVDVEVKLFAKHRSSPWLPIGEGENPIDRQLLVEIEQ